MFNSNTEKFGLEITPYLDTSRNGIVFDQARFMANLFPYYYGSKCLLCANRNLQKPYLFDNP